jgi:hypothetical protein
MRRWLLVALLFVLPLQSIWAAAVPYCAHEAKPGATAHFGHHEHEHQGATSALADAEEGTRASVGDVDCGICHLGASATLLCSEVAVQATPVAVVLNRDLPRYRSHIPSRPERPNIA